MKCFLTHIILVVSLLVFISCNKEDGQIVNDPVEGEITLDLPSNFEITIDASFSNAEISWIQNIGINNENLLYSIYLDNDLVEENITEQFYEIQNLTSATTYDIKIDAKNEIGITTEEVVFETLDPLDFNVLLHTYEKQILEGFDRSDYLFEYNSENKIISAINTLSNSGYDYLYNYDENGKLVKQYVEWNTDFNNAFWHNDFVYQNSQILNINQHNYSSIINRNTYNSYNYTDNNTIEYIKTDDFGLSETYTITLQRDNQNRIIHLNRINNETQNVEELTFVYENGNIIQIIELPNNNILDIEYDAYTSFMTFNSYLGPIYIGPNLPHLGFFGSSFSSHWGGIYDFIYYSNENNPTSIKINGAVRLEYSYEYNDFGYPSKLTETENGSVKEYELEYLIQ